MAYVVTNYAVVAGTTSRRKVYDRRFSRLDRAVAHAVVSAGLPEYVTTVAVTGPHGRTLLGTARTGTFEPATAYATHVRTQGDTPMPAKTTTKTTPAKPESATAARRRMREETATKAEKAAAKKPATKATAKPAAAPKTEAPAKPEAVAKPGPIVWTALPATQNGDRRIVGARGRAVTRVYTGGNAERAMDAIDAIVALPALVRAARELVSTADPKLTAGLRKVLATIPTDEKLADLG